jgi:GH25 family lysozyme M1 (1,4-beta-N-acetylmuramidase)
MSDQPTTSDQPARWNAGTYPPPQGTGRPYGVDVSDHNGNIDWTALHQSGGVFAFIKASEGTGYTPTSFPTNWRSARAAGVLRSAYHYFHPELSGSAQADYFLQRVQAAGGFDQTDIYPTVDVEDSFGRDPATVEAELRAFISRIRAQANRPVIIYTYPYYMRQYLPHITDFVRTSPLWFASYGSPPEHYLGTIPWTFWQYSDQGTVPGVPLGVDLNVFNGTPAQLRQLTGTHPYPPPPTPSPLPQARYFPQTGHYIEFGFRDKWEQYEALGKALEVIGYPIEEPKQMTIGTWTGTVQYFERARMEFHQELTPHVVLFGRLGAEAEAHTLSGTGNGTPPPSAT